jgi:alcohol dehydrogenase (cytochrome c)
MSQKRSRKISWPAVAFAVVLASCSTSHQGVSNDPTPATASEPDVAPSSGFPDAHALVSAGSENSDWILPGKNYSNNRYTGLSQITPQNVHSLAKAWSTELADHGQQETSILVWHGMMYFATPHDNVLAMDAVTGKVKWQYPYNPAYSLVYTVSRGVGLENGKIFLATLDCRIIAIDATTGKKVFNVNGCPSDRYTSTKNALFSMASYVYKNEIIVGTGGGDNGNIGHVMAFSTQDGHRIWDWHNIPFPGEAGHSTWPGNSWHHGGGDTWGGITIDPSTQTVFISTGNPGPDMVDTYRKGLDLYTDSVLALDISGAKPKLRWYYQLIPDDTHDADAVMPPALFDAKIDGKSRPVLAVGDKAANFAVLDRATGKQIYRLAVDNQTGLLSTKPTLKGTYACPNHGGGIEWNGGAYDPATNRFFVPSTQECAVWKIATTDPKYIPGQLYLGGALPKRRNSTGELTAIDMATGKIAWVKAMPSSGQGGVVVTRTGIVFTTDEGGDVFAFDTKGGRLLWKGNTGASIIAPLTAYSAGGNEYLAVVSGSAGAQQTPNVPMAAKSLVTAYRLGPIVHPIANGTTGQLVVAGTSAQNASEPASVGSVPYTAAQVYAGAKLYQRSCSVCHGAQLQGVSAPALTGMNIGNSHLNLTQLRSIVTTQMPLTAPGSLKPDQYASIMAYLLMYDCVAASNEGTEPFPTTNQPEFTKVIIGGRSCPVKH